MFLDSEDIYLFYLIFEYFIDDFDVCDSNWFFDVDSGVDIVIGFMIDCQGNVCLLKFIFEYDIWIDCFSDDNVVFDIDNVMIFFIRLLFVLFECCDWVMCCYYVRCVIDWFFDLLEILIILLMVVFLVKINVYLLYFIFG